MSQTKAVNPSLGMCPSAPFTINKGTYIVGNLLELMALAQSDTHTEFTLYLRLLQFRMERKFPLNAEELQAER